MNIASYCQCLLKITTVTEFPLLAPILYRVKLKQQKTNDLSVFIQITVCSRKVELRPLGLFSKWIFIGETLSSRSDFLNEEIDTMI